LIQATSFCTNLYQKPQNTYLYFAPSSFHQPSVFKSFIKAEVKRYRICCSKDDDFLTAKNNFVNRLLARGYDSDYLNKVMNFEVDRTKLLANLKSVSKMKDTSVIQENNKIQKLPILFKTNYTQRQISIKLKNCLLYIEALNFDKKSELIFKIRNKKAPTLCYKRSINLKEILISSKFQDL
jgi:hypothetical protein